MQHEFLQSIGLLFTEREMSELAAPTTSKPLTSLPAASPAKTLATPDAVPDLQVNDPAFGTSSRVSLASFDPATCSWKTSQLSLHGELTPFSARWPRSGTMQNGIAYKLPTLAPRISGTAFSYWPTATVPNGGRSPKGGYSPTGMTPDGKKRQVDLQHAVRMVMRGMWPAPQARDYRNGHAERYTNPERSNDLNDAVAASYQNPQNTAERNGQLNPQWVEWLMGFPIGWTDLED